MKKTILLLILCVTVSFLKAQRFEYVYKGVQFKCKVDGNSACITAFNVKAQNVVIPSVVVHKGKDYPVKQVSTFLNGVNYLTESLILEDGIEDVDKYCFNEFRKLRTVTLPPSIKHIGKNAFRDNEDMTLVMPASFDEGSIRGGAEIFPENGGEMVNVNSHVVERESKEAAKEEKNMAKIEEKRSKNKAEALKKELEEQKRLMADKEKEQKRLLAEAEKENKRLREKAEKAQKENQTDVSEDDSSNKLLGFIPFGKKKKRIPETPKTEREETAAVETKPAVKELPPADVDINIPLVSSDKNQDMYCVIIANEKYEDVPEVEYAQRDGKVFKEYCMKTLGIPEKQIKIFLDASYTDIKRALNWMETIANVTEGNSKMLFYYAGHGMPDEKDKTAYLIPTDGFPKDITTCFKLSELYGRLAKMQTKSVTVFLDACFSGVKRGSGQALVAARGIAIKPKEEVLGGNLVVFTAASDDETALAYKEKRHGMFTYFLLKHLKETKGKISFSDLFTTVSQEVKKNSMLENDKLQTPSVNVSASMKNKWKDLHF